MYCSDTDKESFVALAVCHHATLFRFDHLTAFRWAQTTRREAAYLVPGTKEDVALHFSQVKHICYQCLTTNLV